MLQFPYSINNNVPLVCGLEGQEGCKVAANIYNMFLPCEKCKFAIEELICLCVTIPKF